MKRALDLVGGSALLLLASPVLAVAAVAILATMGTPVLYRQERAGRHGAIFTLLKLRTMRPGGAVDAARITSLGCWLRALSIDELPQLWNVLRGDMSLVGPRPLLPEYLGRYAPWQRRRHDVRPGLTGLAQVSGRNGLSWDEKFALDVRYVDERSPALDLWILWRTLVTVLRRDGVSAAGHATMPEFLGSAGTGGRGAVR